MASHTSASEAHTSSTASVVEADDGRHRPAALLGAGLHGPAARVHHLQGVGEAQVARGHQSRVLARASDRRPPVKLGALFLQHPPRGHAAGQHGQLGAVGAGELLHGTVPAQLADVPAENLAASANVSRATG